MSWFRDFYEQDYYKYYFEPKLAAVPAQEVQFIIDQGKLVFGHSARPRVFDICCGIGRHARPLAARGAVVTGVDLSTANIQAAREQAAREQLTQWCVFHESDIRHYDPPANCDLAINIFTSFGYFDSEQEDAVIMAQAAQALRQGGRFILDVANREAVISKFKPLERRGMRGNYVIEQSELDLTASRLKSRWTFVRGKHRSEHFISIRLYALHELIRMAGEHGLQFVQAFGSFSAEPYGRRSPRCILVTEKCTR